MVFHDENGEPAEMAGGEEAARRLLNAGLPVVVRQVEEDEP